MDFYNRKARADEGSTWDYEIKNYKCGIKGHRANKSPDKSDYESPEQPEQPMNHYTQDWAFKKTENVSKRDLDKTTMTKNGKRHKWCNI